MLREEPVGSFAFCGLAHIRVTGVALYSAGVKRKRLRTRVLLLTGAFTIALFFITIGLSWRAHVAQQRWTRLVSVEVRAVARLEQLVRAQSAFHTRWTAGQVEAARYRVVTQLLGDPSLTGIDIEPVRARMNAFFDVISEERPRRRDVDATSNAVIAEAERIARERKREIDLQLPQLEREASSMTSSGLAVSWIIALLAFASVQLTLKKVVKPLEDLSLAADRVASGDLTATAPIAGDLEIAQLGRSLNRMADELKSRARTDELTSLPNFRAFRERIDEEIERSERYEEPFGVMVLDLDRFKNYNDTWGHAAGNVALRNVALTIRQSVRVVDFAARYGGEEFAVVLPQIDRDGLVAVAERVRESVEALPAPAGGAKVTVSIGAALYPFDGNSRESLFQRADQSLYEAKRLGRNRVVTTSPAPLEARSAVPLPG